MPWSWFRESCSIHTNVISLITWFKDEQKAWRLAFGIKRLWKKGLCWQDEWLNNINIKIILKRREHKRQFWCFKYLSSLLNLFLFWSSLILPLLHQTLKGKWNVHWYNFSCHKDRFSSSWKTLNINLPCHIAFFCLSGLIIIVHDIKDLITIII